MFHYGLASCLCLAELLIIYFFFSGIAEHRNNILVSALIGAVLFETEAVIIVAINSFDWRKSISLLLTAFLFTEICFKIRIRASLAFTLILVALDTLVSLIVTFTVWSVTEVKSIKEFNLEDPLFVIALFAGKAVLFFVSIVLLRIIRKKGITYRFPGALYLFSLGTIISTIAFWYIGINSDDGLLQRQLLVGVSFFVLCFLIFVFLFYQYSIEQRINYIRVRNENKRLVREKLYFDILDKQNKNLQACIHDAKNHLNAIADKSKDESVKKYAKDLKMEYDRYSRSCQSGNKMLDIILDKYDAQCELQHIQFDFDVKTYAMKDISDMHLVTIISNLLDNAIQAAIESEKRAIVLETCERGNFGVLIITNSCDRMPNIINHQLMTTKKNPNMHGFGLGNVNHVLEYYHGGLDWDYNTVRKEFTVTVMITKKG